MLEKLKILWFIDWGEINRKNWAEKERVYYQKQNKDEYEFFSRRLTWFQGRPIEELQKNSNIERIGKNKNGYKLNFKVYKKTIRIFGYLDINHKIFYALLFLVKKTNQVTLKDLEAFKERIKIYEK